MKRYEKIFYLIEMIIVVVFIAISYFISKDSLKMNSLVILFLSLGLTTLASVLNTVVMVLQKEKN